MKSGGRSAMGGVDSSSERDPAYDLVSFREFWGTLSLLCFLASLTTRQILSLLPFHRQGYLMIPPLAVMLVPVISGIGVLLGLMGNRRRGAARIGFLANLTVFVLSSLLVAALWAWRAGLRL